MTPKSLIGLGAVTAVVAIAAIVTVANQQATVRYSLDEKPVFAGLEGQLNSVASFTVTGEGKTFTMKRDGAKWTMAEKHDYPVDAQKARNLLFELSQLRLSEPKTSMKDLYPRIHVEDVDGKDAKSLRVAVVDKSGKTIADLIVGKEHPSAEPGMSGVYIRKPGQAQSWLARGTIHMQPNATYWLANGIVDVGDSRVKRIERTLPGGETMIVFKKTSEDKDFQVEDVPQGEKIKTSDVAALGRALSDLKLTDVLPAADRELPKDKATTARYITFDGLVVDITLDKIGDNFWARFMASTDADADAKVKTEADAINARVKGWVYEVPDYKVEGLLKKHDQFFEKS